MPTEQKSKALVLSDALTSLDRINTAIVESADLEAMLTRLLDEVLDIFQADRAWFMYPCDPETNEIIIRRERYRPEWPGLSAFGGVLPVSDSTKAFLELCQNSVGPIRFDPEEDPIESLKHEAYKRFNVKSQLALPLKPSSGPNWVLAIQHCSEAVVYDQVTSLFHAVGKRIANGLTTALTIEKLRESEQRYRAIVDRAPDALLISDLDTGKYIEANPMAERLFGMSVESLIDTYGPADLSPEFQPDGSLSSEKAKGYIMDALAGDFPKFEWTHQTVTGDLVPCEISLGRFPDPSRNLVCGTIADITDRKAAEALRASLEKRLSHSQRLETVGQMTGGVAHDFNNLLSVVLGNLELLLLEAEQDDVTKEFVQNGIDATYKGAELIKNMLSFARQANLSPTELQLNEVVTAIKSWSGRTIPATIELKMSLADDLWPVLADPASTDSSVLNLIINARDAMKDTGILTIEACNMTVHEDEFGEGEGESDLEPGRYVMLAVSDTGTGISQGRIGRVFEPFYTTKATGQGSGLGLSMVHGFMKQSGGSVHLYSEPGVGTTVKLFFPAISNDGSLTQETREEKTAAEFPPARILVAEDQPEVMKILLRILKNAGHDVVGADSGDRAFELFQSNQPFDLLLTDIVMPGKLQGPTLARKLREIQPKLQVVFMTGYATEAAMHGNGLRKEDIRLMKPVSRTRLLEAIKAATQPNTENL